MAEFCKNDTERRDLLFLSSKSGSSEYLKVAGERTTIIDFLNTFKSCQPSLEVLLSYLPLLHPRFYTIANSPLSDQTCIEIIFNTFEYTTPEGFLRKGICSSWLERAHSNHIKISLVPRPNADAFRPSLDPDIPLIMLCAGTGLSPFIGYLRHFNNLSKPSPFTWLFYGFRDSNQNYLFKEEIEAYASSSILQRLSLAVSRQPELGFPKYVQHALKDNMKEIYSLLSEKSGILYICGDELTMVKEVNNTLIEMVQEFRQADIKEAAAIVQTWTKEGRIKRDIWI